MGRFLVGLALVATLAGLWLLWSGAGRPVSGSAPSVAAPAVRAPTPPAELAAPELAPLALETDSTPADIERAFTVREPIVRAAVSAGDDLLVEVVDPGGQPRAGIPLRLERGTNEVPEGTSVPEAQVTDAAGRARFAGIRRVLEEASVPWTLRLELPFAEPPSLVLDRATLAPAEVVWVLPWGGELDVVVRELDGAPAPKGSTVQLRLVREEERLNPVLSGPDWKTELQAGTAHYPWVEVGQLWEVSAWRPDGTTPTRTRALGPSAGGEHVQIELVLGADHAVVSFRAVDVERKPLAGVALELARRQVFGGIEKTTVTTDAQGRFTLDGETSFLEKGDLVVTYRPGAEGTLQGRAHLPDFPKVGWNDGGDVVLEGEPVLCAGRVLDEGRQSVADAAVVVGDEGHGWFGRSGAIRGTCDARGCFELRGLWDEDEFELHAEVSSQRSETLHAHQGDTEVVLVLSPRYTIAGRLLVDPGIDPGAIRFQLQASGAEPVNADRQRDDPLRRLNRRALPFSVHESDDDPARFVLEPVRAGEYELLCLLAEVELARVAGLSVHGDLDVGSIDLRGRIHACEITLVGVEDPTKLAGELSWKAHGSDADHGGRIEGSLVRILTPTLPIDVVLRPRGYRQARVEDLSARAEIALEPPLHVRVVLHTDGEFPAPPYVFGCDLHQGDASAGEAQGMPYFTAESREIEWLVSAPGKVSVHWHLERRLEGVHFGGSIGGGVLDGHEIEIDVLDVAGEQVFELPLDGATLTELARNPPWK
ncbi:MAG: hypothetical protein EXS08_03880 [Planctomycetes bacterium]|nr:hypothetical protein [Planctomycetota bacterium]